MFLVAGCTNLCPTNSEELKMAIRVCFNDFQLNTQEIQKNMREEHWIGQWRGHIQVSSN